MNKWREVLLDSNVHFPGESSEYRRARNELLEDEAALKVLSEKVAAKRRALPAGGLIKEDYVFEYAAEQQGQAPGIVRTGQGLAGHLQHDISPPHSVVRCKVAFCGNPVPTSPSTTHRRLALRLRRVHHRARWRARYRGRAHRPGNAADPGPRLPGPICHGAPCRVGRPRHCQRAETGVGGFSCCRRSLLPATMSPSIRGWTLGPFAVVVPAMCSRSAASPGRCTPYRL